MTNLLLNLSVISPSSWAVQMLAMIIGLTIDTKTIDLANNEQKSAAYLEINPMGTVPSLQDGLFNVSEGHAIDFYLLNKYAPSSLETLYPSKDLEIRAQIDQALFFDNGIAFAKLDNIAKPAFTGDQDSISVKQLADVIDVYTIMERYLSRHKFAASEAFTIADLSLGSTFTALQELVPIDAEQFPRVAEWLNELQARQYFKDIALPASKRFGDAVRKYMEINRQKKIAE